MIHTNVLQIIMMSLMTMWTAAPGPRPHTTYGSFKKSHIQLAGRKKIISDDSRDAYSWDRNNIIVE